MEKILKYLSNHGLFLFQDFGFRFVDSLSSKSFGGSSYVDLTNDEIKIRFVYSRDGLFLEFSPASGRKNEWFSFEILGQLLNGDQKFDGELNKENAEFFKVHFSRIMDLFSSDNLSETIQALHLLEKERAKKLFK